MLAPVFAFFLKDKGHTCIEVSADPVETLVNPVLVNSMINEINEPCRVQACVNGGSNLLTITNGTIEKGREINQGNIRAGRDCSHIKAIVYTQKSYAVRCLFSRSCDGAATAWCGVVGDCSLRCWWKTASLSDWVI
jgi:hypothetical protein